MQHVGGCVHSLAPYYFYGVERMDIIKLMRIKYDKKTDKYWKWKSAGNWMLFFLALWMFSQVLLRIFEKLW